MIPNDLQDKIERLEKALRFYADEQNYHPHGEPGILLWEVHENDPSRWWPKPTGWCADRGSIARKALAGKDFYVPWDPKKPPAIANPIYGR